MLLIRPSESLAVMNKSSLRIRHVPVLEDGALAGIVSIGDVVKSRIEELEEDRDALFKYIKRPVALPQAGQRLRILTCDSISTVRVSTP